MSHVLQIEVFLSKKTRQDILSNFRTGLASFTKPDLSDDDKSMIQRMKGIGGSRMNKDFTHKDFIQTVRKGRVTKPVTVYRAGDVHPERANEWTLRKRFATSYADAEDRKLHSLDLKPGDHALFSYHGTRRHGTEVGVFVPPNHDKHDD